MFPSPEFKYRPERLPIAVVWLLALEVSKELYPIATLLSPSYSNPKALLPTAVFWSPPYKYCPAWCPIQVLWSPDTMSFPASYPNKVFWSEEPVKFAPAPVPPTVFPSESDSTPPNELPSAFAKLVAVTIPLKYPSPEEPKLTPIPGILKWLIPVLPNVISDDTVPELGWAFCPIHTFPLPLLLIEPAEYPTNVFAFAEFCVFPAS